MVLGMLRDWLKYGLVGIAAHVKNGVKTAPEVICFLCRMPLGVYLV